MVTVNKVLSKKNKFIYSCSINIHASGFKETLKSIFCILLVVEAFSLQKKVVKMLGKVVVDWWEVNKADEAEFRNQVHATFEALVVRCVVGHCRGEKNGLFLLTTAGCRHCSFPYKFAQYKSVQYKQFSVANLIHLLNTDVLRCIGFSGIQKAPVDQPSSRPLNSDLHLFWIQDWLWEVLWSFFSV